MADEEPYITSIPGEPLEFFMYQGSPCVIYEENGERKGAHFEPPDRFYPIDPWLHDWGDIAGVAYTRPIDQWSFEMYVGLDCLEYKQRTKDKDEKEGPSGAN